VDIVGVVKDDIGIRFEKKSGCQQCPEQQEKIKEKCNQQRQRGRGVGVRVGVEGVRKSRKDRGVIESGSCVS